MKIRPAHPEEKQSYRGIHPLYGFAFYFHRRPAHIVKFKLPIEYLGEGKDQPNYEVLAADGHIFNPEGTHSLLATSLTELRMRLRSNTHETEVQS